MGSVALKYRKNVDMYAVFFLYARRHCQRRDGLLAEDQPGEIAMNEFIANCKRLIRALDTVSDEGLTALANLLRYEPGKIRQDIEALKKIMGK